MKIIFDNESEKTLFMDMIAGHHCPSQLRKPRDPECNLVIDEMGDCTKCWKNCGIEMEVSNEDNI